MGISDIDLSSKGQQEAINEMAENSKNQQVITVWKNGTWKIWSKGDAHYAADDTNWLVNIPID